MFYLRRIYLNLHVLYRYLMNFSPLIFGILFISLWLIWREKKSGFLSNRLVWLLLTIFLYTSGYLLIFLEPRYLWPVYFLFLIMLGLLLQLAFSKIEMFKTGKFILLSILTLFLIYYPLKDLYKNFNIDKDTAMMASEIKSRYNIHGNIASDAGWSWFNSLFLCYHLKCTYYGAATEGISKKQLLEAFKKYKIDYYFDWKERDVLLEGYPELTNGSLPELKIYQIAK